MSSLTPTGPLPIIPTPVPPPVGIVPTTHPGDALSARRRAVLALVLGALTALGPFTIDLYLPAFPAVQSDLGVTEAQVQLTLAGTMLGFALGQLVVGPLSDRLGRRIPLVIANVLHIIGCAAAYFAPTIEVLLAVRVLQGVGAAGGGVVAMAAVRDLFGGRPLVRMLSRLALVSGLAPILAPLIGSQLLLVTDWRGLFVFLAGYGLLTAIAVALLVPETLPKSQRRAHERGATLRRYAGLARDRVFVGVALIGGATFGGLFAYLQGSTFVFQEEFGFSAQEYGVLFAVNSVGVMIGVQTASRLTKWIAPQWILAGAGATFVVSAGLIVLLPLWGAGVWGVIIPLWFFIAACGFSFPCIQVLALAHHGEAAGTAASLLGATNFGVAGLLSPLVGVVAAAVQWHPAAGMAVVMLGAGVLQQLLLWFVVRPRTVPDIGD